MPLTPEQVIEFLAENVEFFLYPQNPSFTTWKTEYLSNIDRQHLTAFLHDFFDECFCSNSDLECFITVPLREFHEKTTHLWQVRSLHNIESANYQYSTAFKTLADKLKIAFDRFSFAEYYLEENLPRLTPIIDHWQKTAMLARDEQVFQLTTSIQHQLRTHQTKYESRLQPEGPPIKINIIKLMDAVWQQYIDGTITSLANAVSNMKNAASQLQSFFQLSESTSQTHPAIEQHNILTESNRQLQQLILLFEEKHTNLCQKAADPNLSYPPPQRPNTPFDLTLFRRQTRIAENDAALQQARQKLENLSFDNEFTLLPTSKVTSHLSSTHTGPRLTRRMSQNL